MRKKLAMTPNQSEDLNKRLSEMEKRILELEKRPSFYPVPYPVYPWWPNGPWWNPYWVMTTTPAVHYDGLWGTTTSLPNGTSVTYTDTNGKVWTNNG